MNVQILLPDGSTREYPNAPTLDELAADLGAGLARDCICGRIDGQLVDASEPIQNGQKAEILTAKNPEGLEVLRHSCAHLLGHALKQLWPDARMAIGPVIEDGFYYDVYLPQALTPDDLPVLEERMKQLAKSDYPVVREVVSHKQATQAFDQRHERYKTEIVADIPEGETIALYHHQEYIDMCRGPHVTNTRHLRHFQLTHLAGAYWRGDPKRGMLQRIYGTAWRTHKELKDYLKMREEARKRDHRLIGREMGLYHWQEEAPGMAFWHQDGWKLYRISEDYIRTATEQADYMEIRTPQLLDIHLWEKSGHAEKFGDAMFLTGSEKRTYAIKPMNCPAHVQVFKKQVQSYRDLPLRLAEFGLVHRNEPSGTLHGLMRVRAFTQDDAHIFCTEQQVADEVAAAVELARKIYYQFGFRDDQIGLALSTRPEQRLGSDETWDKSEQVLADVLNNLNLDFELQEGEGAFYGPKIELTMRDSMKRTWQCGTVQLDYGLPERLGATYADDQDNLRYPVLIHRALFGSLERFIGILIEHYAGRLPLWLAPCQAVILSISERHASYCQQVQRRIQQAGISVRTDLRNERVNYKIREQHVKRVPYVIVIGDKEVEQDRLSVRTADRPYYQLGIGDTPSTDEWISAMQKLLKH
ncbi:MAG: threonine--tRNA ligase [Gammaproteobacteria bacterium]